MFENVHNKSFERGQCTARGSSEPHAPWKGSTVWDVGMVPTAWCEGVFLYLHLHPPNVCIVAMPHYLCPVLSALSISLHDSSKRGKSTYLNRTHLMINIWNLTIYSFCPYPRQSSTCLLFLCFLTFLVNSLFLIQRIQNRILTMSSMCSAHNIPQSFQIDLCGEVRLLPLDRPVKTWPKCTRFVMLCVQVAGYHGTQSSGLDSDLV